MAREFLVGLPHELDAEQRQQLAREFAQSLVDRYGLAVDVCIHAPDKDGDQRNHHAHILATTRRMGPEGLTEKTRELDDRTRIKLANGEKGPAWGAVETMWVRHQFQHITNAHLERAGLDERIDMRSYKDQGKTQEPTQHMGPAATAIERRKPGSTRIGQENQERKERNLVHELFAQETEEAESQIWFIETELEALGDERKQLEIEIELKAERQAREAEIERQLAAEREREAERQAAEDAAAQAAADRDLEEIRAAQKAEEAARRERALERLQGVMPDMIRRTLEFMERYGIAPPESVRKALEDRGYIEPPEQPEKPPETPLTALERDFQQRQQQQRDDRDDEHQGPGFG